METIALPFTEQDLNATIAERFIKIAGQFPEQVAAKSEHQAITYRALDQRSSRQGRFLADSLGAGQLPVALLIEDQVDMVVAILAIIRAGHFYCALRSADPPGRLTEALEDLGSPILLASAGMLPLARQVAPAGCRVIATAEAVLADDSPFLVSVAPKSFAAIFYTSGSTGEPKGAPYTHQNLLHRGHFSAIHFMLVPTDHFLLLYPFSSAASMHYIFDALFNGATLVFFEAEKGLGSLAETLQEEHITALGMPTQLMRSFLDNLPAGSVFPYIRFVIIGASVVYPHDVERIRSILSREAMVIHVLASSEVGLLACNIIHQDTLMDSSILSAGFPIPGKESLILDEHHHTLPPGEVGEIAIRTEMLFPGYWHRPDLNSQIFAPDPANPSRQIFLTGDMGRFRPDGQLEFIGRKDSHVKIREFTVDLSAIESVLMSIPEVKHAVVLAWPDLEGNKRLAAYVVWRPKARLSPTELRKHIAQRLPDYMQPAAFITMDRFPLTTTGKVDPKALAAPDWNQLQQETAYMAPRDKIEKQLAAIWQKALKLEKVGVRDGFIDLGGDSLIAAALFMEIGRTLGMRLPISAIFEYDTVEKLAEVLRNPGSFGIRLLIPLRATGTKPPLFLFPGGLGDAMAWRHLVPYMGEDQPLYSIQALQNNGSTLYGTNINDIAARFLQAIRALQPYGPYYLAGYSFGGVVALETAKQLSEIGEKVAFLGIIDTNALVLGKRRTFSERVRWHIKKMEDKSWQARFRYIARSLLPRLSRNKTILDTLPVIKRHIAKNNRETMNFAIRLYRPGHYSGPATVFKVPERPMEKMEGWKEIIQKDLQIVNISGNHMTLLEDPYVRDLASKLNACIEQAQSNKLQSMAKTP
ncbi:MAG: AMP-binding protein [Anaerolineales bacterium]